ncbi:MAG: chromate resistance protein ChrB domain-containing protein [Pseudomonadota bacterium]
MPGPNEITPEALMRLIGTPDAPTLFDVCLEEDFAADPRLVPTARRVPHTDIVAHAQSTRRAVVICQKGKKLSHGAAALLRAQGIKAEVLEGGVYAWRAASLPMIRADALRGPLWVTRHRPKIDRIACPWLIRRFIQPEAQFLFVPSSEVLAVAERFGATAFDTAGAPFSDSKEGATFDALLSEFSLDYQPLHDLAKIVRAADSGGLGAAPQAAGLLAVSIGFSKMHRDDQAQLEATMPLYDALFRWARDGQNETHSHGEPAQ